MIACGKVGGGSRRGSGGGDKLAVLWHTQRQRLHTCSQSSCVSIGSHVVGAVQAAVVTLLDGPIRSGVSIGAPNAVSCAPENDLCESMYDVVTSMDFCPQPCKHITKNTPI
jgi:hypothetical protein